MKKTLLFACVAIMSLSASAQVFNKNVTPVLNSLKAPFASTISDAKEMTQMAPSNLPATKIIRKAEANNGIFGLYVMENEMDDEGTLACDSIKLEAANKTIGETACNVKFTIPNVNTEFYGVYDEATKTITCNPQDMGTVTYNGSDRQLSICPVVENAEDGNLYYGTDSPMTFTVEDDGSLSFGQYALWVFFDGDYKNNVWITFYPRTLKPANAVACYYMQDESEKGYSENYSACSIADYGFQVTVSGLPWLVGSNGFHLGPVLTIDVNDDGTVSMPANQNLWPTQTLLRGVGDDILALVGDYYLNWGVIPTYNEETQKTSYKFNTDLENGTVPGTIEGNRMVLAPFPCATVQFTNPTTGKVGQYGFWTSGSIIQLLNGNFTNGIAEINAESRLDAAKNAKCYNALGQRVSANAKGLVIRGGKKFFNK